ncbi:ABC transporter substrate-binding protein [Planomonospora parontospora]|uniref:ABC transporter substrate-binding protein n=1 Tax=Planomonospora parontospora TaxID=58119 RepID=UPI001944E972|nr:ABC transporter substrate-binding protein [Planomonospora parontospora]
MKTPKKCLIGLVVGLVFTLASCGLERASAGAPPGEATIGVGSMYEPQNLDNAGGGGQGATEALTGNVYEGLFRLTDGGGVENLLAESHTVSPDGLTYTFRIRDGVTFHSGAPLTPDDVAHSIRRVTAAGSTSSRRGTLDMIESIRGSGRDTVVVKLSSRSISFVYNLSQVWIVNDAHEDLSASEDGTGPYRLGTWKRGSSLSLDRFDGYWGRKAANARVVFRYFTDASALNNALLTGAVDVVTGMQSPDALALFDGDPGYRISNGKSTTKLLLAFNNRRAPFDRMLVRKAVSSAIDERKLLDSIWNGYGSAIGSMVPPSDPWYEDLTHVNPYDVELARRQLAEAGYPRGFTFTLDTPTYDPHPTVATFVKSELAKVGITVEINMITADEWYTKVYRNHDFTATLQEHVNDRDVRWYGDPGFYWGYDNPQVAREVKRAERAGTVEEQTALLRKVGRRIAADAASNWLFLYPQIVIGSSGVSGYPVNGLNAQFYVYDIVKR